MNSSARVASLLLGALLVVVGCKPSEPTRAQTAPAEIAPGAADGYVFSGAEPGPSGRSDDGTIHNGVALGRDPSVPASYSPLARAKLALFETRAGEPAESEPVATTESRSDGYARFERIPPGLYKLRVTPPSGTPAEFQLTTISDATVRWGKYPVTRDRALEAARRALGDFIRPNATFIHAPQTPLPPKVTVGPALGDDDGQQEPSLRYTLATSQWFFYVNPFASARFQHPTRFAFVDAVSGAVTVREATSWPAINGLSYYWNADTIAVSADLLLAPSRKSGAAEATPTAAAAIAARHGLMSTFADHVPGCPAPKTFALLIRGNDDGSQKQDIETIKTIFGRGGIPSATFSEWTPHANAKPLDEVRALWEKIKSQATECDHIFIYVTAHATRGGAAELERNSAQKDGTKADPEKFSVKFLDWTNCKACHITIVLDTCYAGKALNDLKPIFIPLTGRKVFIFASSAADKTSGSFERYDPAAPTGSAFTNGFVAGFNELAASGGTVPLDTAFAKAVGKVNANTDAVIQKQSPQYWERKLLPGETCVVTATTSSSPTPVPPPTSTSVVTGTTTSPSAPPTPGTGTTSRPTTAPQAPTPQPTPVPTPQPTRVPTPVPTPVPTSQPAPTAPSVGGLYGTFNVNATLVGNACYSPYQAKYTVSGNPDGSGLTISFTPDHPPAAATHTYRGTLKADGTFTASGSGQMSREFSSPYTATMNGRLTATGINATEVVTLGPGSGCPPGTDVNSWNVTGSR